ncbi:LysR family transcriptional regulator [Staphylococcus gallinarum]|uniref:LysR family transcriptional regulator n=1 Tax=Staphylococcus gallinarum TaxID=1293 RepID=UPI000D1DF37B|nr:LysR family transcriptional regulator [Staphylococcus gallinarum]MCD8822153.1 LysR family transcriptional regulator [Staphylococcus gallinarum]PTL11487.1 LysR family transcriptional regulator [Staphylococcus gallinarum]PTL12557.1 LysR family transcriptional regulator [Staphylococcus gallinarum]RIL34434.1 LysR family transcriptional regulator [Staphylococcus gallinarum]RIO76932.1 LysR family transcriptional regulator [Staphylococcus gallinarum]
MELRHLRYFLAIAKAGSISSAAEILHIAQPPLSRQLKDLERELGFELFERNKKRKVQLTDQGRFFVNKAQLILNTIDDSVMETQEFHEQVEQSLAIGTTIYSSNKMFEQIEQFKQLYTDVRFNIWESDSINIIKLLNERKLDIAYINETIQNNTIHIKHIHTDQCVCIIPQNIAQHITEEIISLEVLAQLPLVLLISDTESGLHKQILNTFHSHQLSANILCECHDSSILMQILSKGFGVTILPYNSITPDILDHYVVKEIEGHPWSTTTNLIWRKNSYLPKMVQAFLQQHDD